MRRFVIYRWLGVAAAMLTVFASQEAFAATDDDTMNGVFVGQVAGQASLAMIADDGGVLAYVCDGRHVGVWFSTVGRTGNFVDVTSRDGTEHLSAQIRSQNTHGRVTYQGRSLPFTAHPARDDAGLYRWEGSLDGVPYLIGWVVLNDGKEVGLTLNTQTGLTFLAPTLATVTTTIPSVNTLPDVNPVLMVVPGSIDLGGDVTTQLVSGGYAPADRLRWPRVTDHRFVAVDVVDAFSQGIQITAPDGRFFPEKVVLLRGGLRLSYTSGSTAVSTITGSGLQTLQLLDSNRDKRVSLADAIWPALRLVSDLDGIIAPGEVVTFAQLQLDPLAPFGTFVSSTDSFGNVLRISGDRVASPVALLGRVADVKLKRIP